MVEYTDCYINMHEMRGGVIIGKNIPVGVESFEDFYTDDYYYIDKTLFIKELLDQKSKVNLFTRPRRFGKTLTLSMLKYFFEDAYDRRGNKVDYHHLFDGCNICDAGERYTKHMGQYPVISLTLKSGKQSTLDSSFACLINAISDEFRRHSYVLSSEFFDEYEIERYKKFQQERATVNEYKSSLKFLCQCLEVYHQKKVILLLDEYDVPLEGAYVNHFYEEMIDFIRELLGCVLKTNDSLYFAVLTGCLCVVNDAPSSLGSKEPRQVSEVGLTARFENTSPSSQCQSIFTGLNNLDIDTILSGTYSEYFGFTDAEVQKMCEDYGMADLYPVVKEWYNGYIFGEQNIYNPWSTLKFVKDHLGDKDALPQPYWANTSANDIVRKMIMIADEEAKEDIESFIQGKAIWKYLHEDVTYDEIESSPENLWNFMFFTGYFKKTESEYDRSTKKYYAKLQVPNEEIMYIFVNKVEEWFKEKTKEMDRSLLFHAFVSGDAKTFQTEVTKLLQQTISFHDYQENFYHGFIAGILTGLDGYIVKSNRESGDGRTDIYVKPVNPFGRAFVVEFKVADSVEQLQGKVQEAIGQIEDRKYVSELWMDGYRDIKKYGIAFFRKGCVVKYEE